MPHPLRQQKVWNTSLVDTSQTAFRADLHSRFDVLVLYDLTREINEIRNVDLPGS